MVDFLSLLDGLFKQGASLSGIQSVRLQHLALCKTRQSFSFFSQVCFPKRSVFSGRLLLALEGDSSSAEVAIGKKMSTAATCAPARQQLATLVRDALGSLFPDDAMEPLVAACTNKFGDYQCNNAMGIWSKIKGKSSEFKSPNAVGQLMFAIEALLESIHVPVQDIEELVEQSEDAMERLAWLHDQSSWYLPFTFLLRPDWPHSSSVVMWSIRDALAIFCVQEASLRTWAQEM
ncbi:hypothetical protein L7F22_045135 [Adiantum nelumboides]|nr:hypothetical protein [Adiantum nelumboides]